MNSQQCRRIPGADTADLLIATGDLTNYGRKSDAKEVLDGLLTVNPNVLAVLGNLDHFEINDYLDQLDLNLHGQARFIQSKVCLIGAGGSNITPFHTPTEFSEKEITEILMRSYEMATEYRSLMHYSNRSVPTILVSHAPPRDTKVDRLRDGRHVGSSAVRAFIETYQPEICLTGHIHESRGEDWIGKTHIVNPGMFRDGGWVDINLHQNTLTATLK